MPKKHLPITPANDAVLFDLVRDISSKIEASYQKLIGRISQKIETLDKHGQDSTNYFVVEENAYVNFHEILQGILDAQWGLILSARDSLFLQYYGLTYNQYRAKNPTSFSLYVDDVINHNAGGCWGTGTSGGYFDWVKRQR